MMFFLLKCLNTKKKSAIVLSQKDYVYITKTPIVAEA